VYFIIAGSSAAKSAPPEIKQESLEAIAKVIPRMPPQDTTQYWVQVGAYKTQTNAQKAFNRAAGAGFSPAFATNEGLVLVLIPGVRGNVMRETAARLYNAGFKEILLRNKP
jgi:cell division protein FtsN